MTGLKTLFSGIASNQALRYMPRTFIPSFCISCKLSWPGFVPSKELTSPESISKQLFLSCSGLHDQNCFDNLLSKNSAQMVLLMPWTHEGQQPLGCLGIFEVGIQNGKREHHTGCFVSKPP